MNHAPSQLSLLTAASQATNASTAFSVFDAALPQEIEDVEIEVHRGMKVHSSAGVAGRGLKGKQVSAKTYSVKIEPNGNNLKAKQVLRENAKMTNDFDYDLQQIREGDPLVDLNDKFCFRQERLKKFDVGKHFPALISPRLVPSWRLANAGQDSVQGESPAAAGNSCSSGKQRSTRTPSKLLEPTSSRVKKQQYKRQPVALAPFISGSTAEADAKICDRNPILFSENYELPKCQQRGEYSDNRDRWLGSTDIRPTNVSESKALFDPHSHEIARDVHHHRERGRANLEALRKSYNQTRDAYQRERDARGPISGFDLMVKKKEEEEARQKALLEAQAKDAARQNRFGAGLAGLGGPGNDGHGALFSDTLRMGLGKVLG